MESPREICLELGERRVPVQIHREVRRRSHHTGRELAELHGRVTTREPEQHRWLAGALADVGDVAFRGTDRDGEFAGDWRISWNAYGEIAGMHTYTLILLEAEELALEALLLGDRELHPYEYREEIVDDGLTIQAKVVGSEAELLHLRELVDAQRVVPVIRRGISETPREMRVGIASWSENDARLKYRLLLVDRELDERAPSLLARMEEANRPAALGYYANFMERLAEQLVERGALSAEEVAAARDAARRTPGISRHDFWRVADIDLL